MVSEDVNISIWYRQGPKKNIGTQTQYLKLYYWCIPNFYPSLLHPFPQKSFGITYRLTVHIAFYPINVFTDFGVISIACPTTNTPRHDTRGHPLALKFGRKWPAAVSLA